MATRLSSGVSRILLVFLLINYSYAEKMNVELEGESHVRRSRELHHLKSLKLRLEWFAKTGDALVGEEYSRDLRDDGTVIEELGLSIVDNVNNGGYDVQPGWVGILQNYFKHRIDMGAFDYQVSFLYREWWEDMRVISFELYDSPAWRRQNGIIYVNLTPDVTGEIVRAVYQFHGIRFRNTMMRVHLLGTSFDCELEKLEEFEFTPVQKQIVSGQPFEVWHTVKATRTRHDSFEILRALQLKLTFTVRVKI